MFRSCENLKDIKLPHDIKKIYDLMFNGCKSINSIKLPSGIISIGYSAFWNCKKLATITSQITDPFNISDETFPSDIYTNAILKVPAGKKSVYQSTNGWKLFKNIIENSGEVVNPTYTLKYVVDGVDYKVLYLYEGDKITPETEPTKAGYTFSGWSNIPATMPAHDVTVTGSFIKDILPKCATPTINYKDGEISFTCTTEGVKFVSEVSVGDAKEYTGANVKLTKVYKVSVYAYKNGYNNSEEIIREIVIGRNDKPNSADVDGNGVVNEADHEALSRIILQKK